MSNRDSEADYSAVKLSRDWLSSLEGGIEEKGASVFGGRRRLRLQSDSSTHLSGSRILWMRTAGPVRTPDMSCGVISTYCVLSDRLRGARQRKEKGGGWGQSVLGDPEQEGDKETTH